MKRGDIVTVATGSGFGGKPRPALVIQSDGFADLATLLVALLTSELTDAPLLRPRIAPDATNGLRVASDVMTDILVTVRRGQVGEIVGTLTAADLARVEQALLLILGFVRR